MEGFELEVPQIRMDTILLKIGPRLAGVDIIVERDGFRDVFSNRVLSASALIEPIGFTTIDFVPSQEVFGLSLVQTVLRNVKFAMDYTPEQEEPSHGLG